MAASCHAGFSPPTLVKLLTSLGISPDASGDGAVIPAISKNMGPLSTGILRKVGHWVDT